jgi:type I restriction enzyme S subunit
LAGRDARRPRSSEFLLGNKFNQTLNKDSMKDGWEIKKLGEVCEIQTGKLDANAKVENGIYPFYTCDAKPYRIDTFAFDDEAILISGNGSLVGHVNYYKGKFNAYQRTYVLTTFNSFNIPFLVSYLKGYLRQYIYAQKKGGCIPYITLPILKNFAIPCPPLPEQKRIVSELDCINGILEKKREQIKELDALAQSIFYHMFGDPVTNEKGWEVKKLGEVCNLVKNGANIKQEKGAAGYPISRIETLSGGVFNRDRLGYANIFSLEKYQSYVLESGDLLLSHINSKSYIGRIVVYIKEGDEAIIHGMNLLRLKLKADIILPFFMYYYSLTNQYKDQIANRRKDAVNQSSIAICDLKTIPIPLPPLSLQQSFATKIEAIEKQKELIKRSIAETETLLASRMQHYFG